MVQTIQICRLKKRLFTGAALLALLSSGCTNTSPDKLTDHTPNKAEVSQNKSPLGNYLSARIARKGHDTRHAARFYDIALSADRDNEDLLHKTMIMMVAEGRMQESIVLAKRLIKKQDRAALARLILATDSVRNNNLSEARKHLLRASSKSFMLFLQPILLAWVEAGDNKFSKIPNILNQLGSKKNFRPFINYHTALISDFAGYNDLASLAFKETLKSSAGRISRVSRFYGGFLSRANKKEEALSLFDNFLGQIPNDPVIRQARKQVLGDTIILPTINSTSDGMAEAFLSAGFALTAAQNGETAMIYSNLALHLCPDLDEAYLLLAEVLEEQKRFKDAIEAYKNVKTTSPLNWTARIRIAANMNNLNQIEKTIALLKKMSAERPNDTSALITAARVLRNQDQFDEAILVFGEAFKRQGVLKKHHWSLLYERGIALERSKRWDAAEADFLKALELRPGEPRVLNYLGYSWIDKGINLERARRMIEQAVAKRPHDGFIVDSLGWAFYRLGEYSKAVKYLEQAIELRPQDPVINDHLGDAYWQVGRKLEAKFQWNHAIDLGAEKDSIPRIQAKRIYGLQAPSSNNDRKKYKSITGE